jgi:hypothetical protein
MWWSAEGQRLQNRLAPLSSDTTHSTPPSPGAEKLKKQIQMVSRQQQAGGREGALRPLLSAVAGLAAPAALVRDIGAAVGEDGEVQEGASEQVRGCAVGRLGRGMELVWICRC